MSEVPAPPPKLKHRASNIHRLEDCRRVLAQVYRQLEQGQITIPEAKARAYLLQVMQGILKDMAAQDMDARLKAVEAKLAEKGITL
jgi:hypothetical protein